MRLNPLTEASCAVGCTLSPRDVRPTSQRSCPSDHSFHVGGAPQVVAQWAAHGCARGFTVGEIASEHSRRGVQIMRLRGRGTQLAMDSS